MKSQKKFFSQGVLVLLFLMSFLTVPFTVHAATFTVNSTVDAVDAAIDGVCQTSNVGQCTLRAAIQEANASVGVPDTIILPAGTYVLSIVGTNEDLAATGDLDIGVGGTASTITITGQGETLTIIDGSNTDRVFETIANGTSVTISLMTIRNGNSGALDGGCIKVGGSTAFVLNAAVVTGCTAAVGGGGIDNTGTLTINTAAVTNNNSPGGAVNGGAASTTIWINGEVSGNSGGGINTSGTMSLTNVTVSGNTTPENGAGIDNDGALTLQNVTINGNTSTTALNIGGLRNRAPGTVTVTNTIIANNLPANCGNEGGTITSGGNNIDNGTTCGFGAATDPLLGALALNAGKLRTHALLLGSPAIDAGTATGCPATDARGIGRPVDGNIPLDGVATCDIGAYEFRPQKIAVTLAPPFDFGDVTTGTTSDHIITLSNAGDGALLIGTIAAADPLAAPFSIPANTCSGQTLPRAGTCTITARFAPIAAAAAADTFDIPSNDPAAATVNFALSGTGTTAQVPIISITDTQAPANDQAVQFGGVTIGNTADATVTITNTGTGSLIIGSIAVANPIAVPFSITADGCSGLTIAPAASCQLTLHFEPTANATLSDTFDIPSNEADRPSITVSVSGSGISATGNNPPSALVLVSPANGQTGLGTTVTFVWTKSVDPDGDAVTYNFFNCTDQSFATCTPVAVAAASSGLRYAGLGSLGAGIIMIGFVVAGGLKRSRTALLLVLALFLTGTVLVACGGGDDGAPAAAPVEQMSHTATGLTSGATYYWKVVADDGKGGTAASEVRSYTTQ